jgi:hypothetical protein
LTAYHPVDVSRLPLDHVITVQVASALATCRIGPIRRREIRAAPVTDPGPDYASSEFGLLPGDGDEYIITSGALKGQRGFFTRDERGAVVGVDLAGRLFSRATGAE